MRAEGGTEIVSDMPVKPRHRFRRLIKWLLVVIALFILADAVCFEPRYPVLSRYDVAIPGLPRGLDGFRIVQLSDLHRSAIVPDGVIRRAVDIANSTSADAAVFTGDFVSRNAANAEPCAVMLAKVRTRCGSYAVLGNHDYWTDAGVVRKSLRKHGITLLKNRSARLPGGLCLVGVDDNWAGKPNVARAFNGVGAKDPYVMLSHTPLALGLFMGRRGLLITGHTHGGQVRIPLIPRSKLPGLRGWKYIDGWYKEGDILMYVNRGIGMVNPTLRFRCRPEVTLYVLHPAGNSRPSVARQ